VPPKQTTFPIQVKVDDHNGGVDTFDAKVTIP
jgi:hypothetical protein